MKELALMKGITVMLALATVFSSATSQTDFDKWKSQQDQQLKKFADEKDRAFLKFLNEEWKAYEGFKETLPNAIPKPRELPEAPVVIPTVSIEQIARSVIVIPRHEGKRDEENIGEKEKQNAEAASLTSLEMTQMTFHAGTVSIPSLPPKDEVIPTAPPYSPKIISGAWETFAETDYRQVITAAQTHAAEVGLNDWGYVLLLNEIASTFYPGTNERAAQTLLLWHLLVKSGYNARVGYNDSSLELLMTARQQLYGVSYFMLGSENIRYYVIRPGESPGDLSRVYTYLQDYPGADNVMDMSMTRAPMFKATDGKRVLTYMHYGVADSVTVLYNKNYVSFLSKYPQTNLEVYLTAEPSREAFESLANNLRPKIEGKIETEAVNVLLHFVQTAFAYKTDADQFGQERWLFPDETLNYPYSDCEDRSILFSFLVRKLLGLEIVGLDYPGHIATAVAFHSSVEGKAYESEGQTYIVCDPTYLNANVGMEMPQFATVTPKIVPLGR